MTGDQEDEDDLFRRTMAEWGVNQSSHPRNTSQRARPKVPYSPGLSRHLVHRDARPSPAAASIDSTHPDDTVLFVRTGVSMARVKQLRRGNIPLQESLDLHGMRSQEAEAALDRYLAECMELRLSCVLLIHGKGRGSAVRGGILKPLTLHWLKQQGEVLAFCEALPADGGSGALYLLLDTAPA